MGWDICPNSTRKEIIADCTKDWENTTSSGVKVTQKCLAKQFKGASYRGTVYAVMEQTHSKDGVVIKQERHIFVALLEYYRENRGWGYKSMEETCGPCVDGCPKKYFDMVPCPDHPWARAWRLKCNLRRDLKAKWKELNKAYKLGKMTYEAGQDTFSQEQKTFDAKIEVIRQEADKEYEAWQAARQAEQLRQELMAKEVLQPKKETFVCPLCEEEKQISCQVLKGCCRSCAGSYDG
jgi:hypothetical protein